MIPQLSCIASVIGAHLIVCIGVVHAAAPISTSITYQGRLMDDGAPHAGPTAQMTFRLYDAVTLGNLIGTVGPLNVPVDDGLFAVDLDFGAVAFNDEARWLEIQVELATLTPRQELTPTAFALQTRGILVDPATGNVAIGDAPAQERFNASGNIAARNPNNDQAMVYLGWGQDGGGADMARIRVGGTGAGSANGLDIQRSSDVSLVRILNNGVVGIGTTSPEAVLHIGDGDVLVDDFGNQGNFGGRRANGTKAAPTPVTTGDTLTQHLGYGYDGTGYFAEASFDIVAAEPWTTTAHGAYLRFLTTGVGGIATSERMRIDANGNVGIGTTGPAQLLQVGSSSVTDTQGMIRLASRSGTGSAYRIWDVGVPETDQVTSGVGYSFVIDDTQLGTDPEFMVQWGTGNVGIGTVDPATDLQVSSSSTSITGLSLTNTSTGGNEFLFQSVGSGVSGRVGNFELWRVGASVSSLAVQTDGDVGIGTNAPTADLHVVGGTDGTLKVGSASATAVQMGYSLAALGAYVAVKDGAGSDVISLTGVDGRIRGKVVEITGADLAEKFPVKETVDPGMVVEIDPDHPGQLRLASGAYNRRVAGVVSGAGGLPAGAILGNLPGSEDHPPIAMTGRVWVHCDASGGAIALGDLLTTSDTPGHAMKVEDYPRAQGAVIGKAMTELREGRGMVLVLVNLQ